MSEEENKPTLLDWNRWVCVLVNMGMPFTRGYCGRVVVDHMPSPIVELEDAFEYTSALQQEGPRTQRTSFGGPIEFTPIKRVTVAWFTRIDLGGLNEIQLRPFHAARINAIKSLEGMSTQRPLIALR